MNSIRMNKVYRTSIFRFLASFFVALLLTNLLRESFFTQSQVYVLFLLFFSIGLLFTEAIPAFVVGLFIISYLVFALGNPNLNSNPVDIAPYVNTFSSSIIWLLLGGFFLAAAMSKTGLDESLFQFTLKLSGANPRILVIALMLTTMLASMIMSNTAATAIAIAGVTPLLNKLGKDAGLSKALLIGIPMAASTGGMGTIIGSPPNAIAAGAIEHAGLKMDFLSWLSYGFPVALGLGILGCATVLLYFVKGNEKLDLTLLSTKTDPNAYNNIQRLVVIIILVITVIMWLIGSWFDIKVASVSAIPLVGLTLFGIMKSEDVKKLPWDTLLLVAGGLSLGIALQKTELLLHYTNKIVALGLSQMLLVFILAYIAMLFSNVMSHTATAALLIPVGISMLPEKQIAISVIIALSSATAMLFPVSTPPNAIAFSTGLLSQKDFRLGGVVMGLLGPAVIVLWVLLVV